MIKILRQEDVMRFSYFFLMSTIVFPLWGVNELNQIEYNSGRPYWNDDGHESARNKGPNYWNRPFPTTGLNRQGGSQGTPHCEGCNPANYLYDEHKGYIYYYRYNND
jgi:hypothetical protein